MNKRDQKTVLKSLSNSMLHRHGEAALAAVLTNLRILGEALPLPETYERARLAAVEAMLKRDNLRESDWLRFHYNLLELAGEACLQLSHFGHRERGALRFIELVISDNYHDWPFH
jgi:hypothetical protein